MSSPSLCGASGGLAPTGGSHAREFGLSQSGHFTPTSALSRSGVVSYSSKAPLRTAEEENLSSSLSAGRKRWILLLMGVQQLLLCISLAIMAPIYPLAARAKFPNRTALHDTFAIGMVLVAPSVVIFLSSPVVGAEVPRLGPKRVAVIGQFFAAGITILFGFMNDIDGWTEFMLFSYALRLLLGVAAACVYVASFAMLLRIYPDAVSSAAAVLEVAAGLGFSVGPAVGGAIYDHGNFKDSFYISGGLMFACMVVVGLIVPPTEPSQTEETEFPKRHVLHNPRCLFMLLVALASGASIAYLDPCLGPYLHNTFMLSPTHIGLSFLAMAAAYAIVAPILGHIADHFSRRSLFLVGFMINTLANGLIAFETLTGVKEKLWMILVGGVFVSVGNAIAFVPVSAEIVETMRLLGFADSYALHGTVGGLLSSAYSLGLAIGPTLGSLVSKSFTLGHLAVTFAATYAFLASVEVAFLCLHGMIGAKRQAPVVMEVNEKTGLLNASGEHEESDQI